MYQGSKADDSGVAVSFNKVAFSVLDESKNEMFIYLKEFSHLLFPECLNHCVALAAKNPRMSFAKPKYA